MTAPKPDPRELLREAADIVERLAAAAPPGRWRLAGLLATRPEVVAEQDGARQHVAEARAASAGWIVALQPAVAVPLATWLRREAVEWSDATPGPAARAAAALEFADHIRRLAARVP